MAGLDDLRAAALACPGAVEMPHFGAPSFRVEGRIFAQAAVKDWQAGGPLRAILRLEPGRQMLLCEMEPELFSPAVWGRIVSLYVDLALVAPDRLAGLVHDSWQHVAQKSARGRRNPG